MSNAKEPYIISVWEEELIPTQDWYIKGETISKEDYNKLSSIKKEEYRPHHFLENNYFKETERLSNEEYEHFIATEKNKYTLNQKGDYVSKEEVLSESQFLQKMAEIAATYEPYTIMEHYEETQGVIISSDEMDSVFSAVNPIFKENVNGSVELTFSLYYKIFDPDSLEFSMNPFVAMLTNEAKIKLKFRNRWYDLVVKNCQEDSSSYMFTYTCKDFYINELNKNGFKVELDSELENNQGNVIELGKTILKDTDWKVNEDKTDIMVESKVEPMYIGMLKYDIQIEKVNNYIPDQMIDGSDEYYPKFYELKAGWPILLFYSELVERKEEPQILAVFGQRENSDGIEYKDPAYDDFYTLDTNEDVITNGCNYRITGYKNPQDEKWYKVEYSDSTLKDNLINIIDLNGLFIYERARAEKVVRSQKTGYDPDMDRFISKYYKLVKNPTTQEIEPDTDVEYYGYSKQDILRTDLTENYLANSDNFTSVDTGWIFDGIPEKRSKKKEAGYVGQIFERTAINEANPGSGVLFEESVLELNLKARKDGRYYKDTQGEFYLIKAPLKEDKTKVEDKFILVESEEGLAYQESTFDLYKKYQREGTPGYAEKTDNELDALVNEHLSSIRYSVSPRVAINTGIAANRDKIGQLSPGEEYLFAVSLGKFKEGEKPLEIKKNIDEQDEITYGIDAPDAYYKFIEVGDNGEFTYNAANKVIDEFKKELQTGALNYYKQIPEYLGRYNDKYNETYNNLKEEYKKRYLRASGFSNDRTKENWQPGGRRKSGLHGLYGEWIGYYEIFLNVLRGPEGLESEEICCDNGHFLDELDKALSQISSTKGAISKQVYHALIDKETVKVPDSEGVIHTYFQGLYPEMVMKTMVHSLDKQKNVVYTKKAAYDIMGYDKGMYPEYDEDTNSLIQITDSFNEFLFSEFYYGILDKWLVPVANNPKNPKWEYTGRAALSSLLKTIYKACYENTNTIFESMQHTKEYHLPSLTNQKGGKYYQIHEATWVTKSKKAAEDLVKELEAKNGYFKPPFQYEEDILLENKDDEAFEKELAREGREYFIKIFCGGYKEFNDNNEFTGTYGKEDENLADYCYEKEQTWLANRTETQLQSAEFANLLIEARKGWIEEYVKSDKFLEIDNFGGALYSAYLLGKFYSQWAYEKDIGTYTYNTDTYDLNFTLGNMPSDYQGALDTYRVVSKEKEMYSEITKLYLLNELKDYVEVSYVEDKYGNNYVSKIIGTTEAYKDLTEEQKKEVDLFIKELRELMQDIKEQSSDRKINWEKVTYFTKKKDASHYAKLDTGKVKTGGYVFDRDNKQVRLFDPYIDVLNATFIPQKDDNGAYVFDPFTWQYRPFRDWDSEEFRDPLTFEIDKDAGVPGDKVFHPLKLFDGKLGAWYDTPTRYNMIRKRLDPDEPNSPYKYLTDDITIIETGHYDGKDYQYEITYPKGYQYDIYIETKRGKYIKASEVNQRRLFDLNNDGVVGIKFSFNNTDFGSLFDGAIESTKDFFEQISNKFKGIFGLGDNTKSQLSEISEAYKKIDDDANKNGAGLASSNANKSYSEDAQDQRYDEDHTSIQLYGITTQDGEILNSLAIPTLDMIANASEFSSLIKSGKAVVIEQDLGDNEGDDGEEVTQQSRNITKTQRSSDIPVAEQYIKYKPYYWRHWGRKRYDYQPKICIQQTVDGIVTYKPYNNIEDKKSEPYFVYPIEEYDPYDTSESQDKVIFLNNRKTTYRQRLETDYEGYKYRMEKVDDMSKNYWIEAPNGENYLRHYKFGDGTTKLFDGHFGRWVQCYSALKVLSTETELDDEKYLDEFYMPYGDIMIPYNQRIFGATTQLTRVRTDYQGKDDEVYVYHNNIFMTLAQYLEEAGFSFKINYDGLKVSFIDDYEYNSSSFAITLPEKPEKYLEFDLSKDCKYIDLVVKENTITSEVVKERWAYWTAPVLKGFSLTENPLQKLGMLFETTKASTDKSNIKSNDIGRYAFLGMQLFKYVPYETSLENITTSEESQETKEETINNALKEVYDGENLYTIDTFIKKINTSYDSITLLNAATSLVENGKTVVPEIKYSQDKDGNEIEEIVDLNVVQITGSEKNIIPLFPGQAPDAADLYFTNYYIYDPDIVEHPDSAIFEYVGQDYSEFFVPAYDETCQKIRSMKGKESNYFKLLQDCCDTFECWMQKDIEHDSTTGQIKYRDRPVFTEILQNEEENSVEPQIFVGEEAKIEGTRKTAARIHHKLFGKIEVEERKEGETDEMARAFHEHRVYKNIVELDEKEKKLLLRLNRVNNLTFKVEYMRVPDKQIYFQRYVGEEKWNGFKYGVNLNHIKRTIDSDQFSTRIIVKPNNNEFGKDKFCTISRAEENPIKENFIFDFSYYINNKLLDNSDLIGDLYTDVNTRLNYYPRLASLNKERDELIIKQSSLQIGLDNVKSKYETTIQLRDAALEEITKLTQLLTSNYDTYGQVISVPWKYNKSQEYTQKRQTSASGTTKIITDTYGEETYSFEIEIPNTTTVVEYPKYNDTMRSYFDQMDVYQKEYINSVKLLEELEPEKERIESELAEIEAYLDEIANKKSELNKLFYHKYSRFIQEGSWIDESYIDDNLYYLDALSVARISSKPKVTYDIGVVDIAAAYEYEEDRLLLESELGDRTYIEDPEFFGYRKDDFTKPYWELVIVTEKTYNLTDPSQNKIQVRNYTTQFEDLFQTIAATSQTLQFNEGSYGRMSSLMNENGTLKSEVLRDSIANSDIILMNATNEDVKIDKTGVTITSPSNRANVVKLVSAGILVSSDGGNHFSTAITGDGINADLLLAGVINTDELLIGGRSNPNFLWNRLGISSFKTNGDKIDYSSFVRMDQYGIYGIQNYSKDDREPQSMSINDAFEPLRLKDITDNPNAVFGLTWEGFFLNAANGTGKVTIGTGQDFRMSEYSNEQSRWIDRVVIGRLNNNDYYGFQLRNSDGQVVMETGDNGELYLKRKLRIANFGDEDTAEPYGWIYDDNSKRILIDEELIKTTDPEGKINQENIIEETVTIGEEKNVERYLARYFYKYEQEGEGSVIKYYSFKHNILFATEVTNKKWEETIQKQSDRVSLGIVDTYKRSQGLTKTNVDGAYSSLEYLTKVFSVKANAAVPLAQFTETEIGRIIETNENLAIFDNGNLFAKNAWIEGNINATSGKISGFLEVSGTLKHSNDQWKISDDGTAYFKNVDVSGTIKSVIFEYEKVQTMGGAMLVVPTMLIDKVTVMTSDEPALINETTTEEITVRYEIVLDGIIPSNKRTSGGKTAKICFIGDTVSFGSSDTGMDEYVIEEMTDDNINKDAKKSTIYITGPEDIEHLAQGKYAVLLGQTDDSTDSTIGIVINSATEHSFYPEQSISIININKPGAIPKTQLGLLSKDLFNKNSLNKLDEVMTGQYGLYSDNVYVKGSMVSEVVDESHNTEYIAGITTTDILEIKTPDNETKNIVLFAGQSLENPSFYVTRDGYLYAQNGYFTGTINTSRIIGNGSGSYALEIDGVTANKALRFIGQNNDNINVEFLSFTSDGSFFYNHNNETQLFSILHGKESDNDEENIVPGVGLFGPSSNTNPFEYLLNFTKIEEKNEGEVEETTEAITKGVLLSYMTTPIAIIDETGCHFQQETDGLGQNCKTVDVKINNSIIGINFVLKNIE